ncbi:hypothetical protein ACFL35_17080 [Candidatus Riflebacteria bacterium]
MQEHLKTRDYQIKKLDEFLFSVFPELKKGVPPIFSVFWGKLWLALDVPKVYLFILTKVFESERFSRVKIVVDSEVTFRNSFDFYLTEEPLLANILELMQKPFAFNLQIIKSNSKLKRRKKSKVTIKNWLNKIFLHFKYRGPGEVFFQIKNKLCKSGFCGNIEDFIPGRGEESNQPQILSVQCQEFEVLEDYFSKVGWRVSRFDFRKFENFSRKKPFNPLILLNELKKNKDLIALFNYKNANYFSISFHRLSAFIYRFEEYFSLFFSLEKFIQEEKYNLVLFDSLTPISSPIKSILAFICLRKKIPYICWMHGGFGAYSTRPVCADFPLAHHYFVYGKKVKERLTRLESDADLHVAGSPQLEKFFASYRKPKNLKKNILFCLPHPDLHNNLNFINSYPNYHFSYIPTILKIFQILLGFQDRYKITVKLAGDSFLSLFKKVKKNLGANFKLIGSEIAFHYLLNYADLVILTWISTSFWQSACTDADIFVLDEGKLTSEATTAIKDRAYLFDNFSTFQKGLKTYLKKGRFSQKKGNKFIREFLDFDSYENRCKKIHELLLAILHNPGEKKEIGSLQKY